MTSESAPKPVFMPYTTSPRETMSSTKRRALSMKGRAPAASDTSDPSATSAACSRVSDAPSISTILSEAYLTDSEKSNRSKGTLWSSVLRRSPCRLLK